jgi:predicted peptidase
MKKCKALISILCISAFSISGIVSVIAQPSLWSFEKYKNANGDSLLYRQLYPDANRVRKYPLVIFLHGSGERGNDNDAQLKWGVNNFASDKNLTLYPAFVIAPQCPTGQGWANFSSRNRDELTLAPTPNKTMELLMELIQQTIKKFPIDTNRIYITGLSMGGFGTFDAISRYPNVFAAAVPVCGGGDLSKVPIIKDIPMWIVTGAEDSAVSPVYSIEMARALQKAGAHPGYTQYPEVGHFSWIMAYSDPLIMEWLFRQRKTTTK